ncbi:hypothetical protein AgCh_023285 [Apium graveolens]
MGERNESNKKGVVPYADPFYLGSSDQSNTPLGCIIFDGKNYINWSRSVKMALGSKNNLGFIDGKIIKPVIGSDDYHKWVRNDYMLRCWLQVSVNLKIAEQMLIVNSAKEFWDELAERYGQSNAPELYMLKKELNDLKQNNMSVGDYYGVFKSFWDQITSLDGIPQCSCGKMAECTCSLMKKIAERDERNKVIDFLMGLNTSYDNLKQNIISMEPLPSVNKYDAYCMTCGCNADHDQFRCPERPKMMAMACAICLEPCEIKEHQDMPKIHKLIGTEVKTVLIQYSTNAISSNHEHSLPLVGNSRLS